MVSIALHPTNANILYVATNDAVYKSRDGGGDLGAISELQRAPVHHARNGSSLAGHDIYRHDGGYGLQEH